jgi:hypothetical protein
MGSNPGAAVGNDEDATSRPVPYGSKQATGSAEGSPPALKKNTAGKKKSLAKKVTRKSDTAKVAGKKPDSKQAADRKNTGIKKAAQKVAIDRATPEKNTAPRSRKRPGLASAATPPDAVAQTASAADTDDPRSLAWMAAAAVKALNAVRENQAAKASHILNAQGAGTSATESVESPADSEPHAELSAVSLSGETLSPGDTGLSPQEQQQPEAAVTIAEDTTLSTAVTGLASEAGKPGSDEAAESAVAQAVEQAPIAVETTAAGVDDPEEPWPRDGGATTGQTEPAGHAPLPPRAVAPRQHVPPRMMAGAVALVLAVIIGYGYLADEDEVAVPVTGETPAVVDHTVQAATEPATGAAAPGESEAVPHEQPVATTAEGTSAGLASDATPVPVALDEGPGTPNIPPEAAPDTPAADAVPQQAATTAPQPVSEPVSTPAAEPASTTASHTTAPVARQPGYRSPGYGYYPPGWQQPGYRYPAR